MTPKSYIEFAKQRIDDLGKQIQELTLERDAEIAARDAYLTKKQGIVRVPLGDKSKPIPVIEWDGYGSWRTAVRSSIEHVGRCLSLAQILELVKRMEPKGEGDTLLQSVRNATYQSSGLIKYRPANSSKDAWGLTEYFGADKKKPLPERKYRQGLEWF